MIEANQCRWQCAVLLVIATSCNVCWRESIKPILFYCNTFLSLSVAETDCFCNKKLMWSNSPVLMTLGILCDYDISALALYYIIV